MLRDEPASILGTGTQRGWAGRIRRSLDRQAFVLHAQPIVALAGDHGRRHELLIRMLGPDGDLIAPGAFLDVAERCEMIGEVDHWVLHQAVELLAVEKHAGRDTSFDVNISAKSAADPELPELLARELHAAGIDGRGLCLEVTETTAIVNFDRARSLAGELRSLGCEFALDDFGAGFTSYRYLKRLEFDYIKIDGEFIHDLADNATSQLIVQSVVDIARGLGTRTVAEHVGDDDTVRILTAQGVDYAQGFHTGRPQPLAPAGLAKRASAPLCQPVASR